MSSKLLQYESSKTVMLYLDPNTRIKMSQHVPALRLLERLVPLRIEHLEIGAYHLDIEKTSYSVQDEHMGSSSTSSYQTVLTVKRPNGERLFHRTKYTEEESMEKLVEFVFGNRNSETQVKFFALSCSKKECSRHIPEGLKFRVRNVKVPKMESQYLDAVNSMITPESIPLDTVESAQFYYSIRILEHHIICNARQLIINKCILPFSIVPQFQNWKNQLVRLKSIETLVGVECFIELVEHWLEYGKDVGTCYTFAIETTQIQEIRRVVSRKLEVIERLEKSVVLSMKSDAKLVVSSDIDTNGLYWDLKLQVV